MSLLYTERLYFQYPLDRHGHVLLPLGIRQALGLKPGDRVEIVADTATGTITIQKVEDGTTVS